MRSKSIEDIITEKAIKVTLSDLARIKDLNLSAREMLGGIATNCRKDGRFLIGNVDNGGSSIFLSFPDGTLKEFSGTASLILERYNSLASGPRRYLQMGECYTDVDHFNNYLLIYTHGAAKRDSNLGYGDQRYRQYVSSLYVYDMNSHEIVKSFHIISSGYAGYQSRSIVRAFISNNEQISLLVSDQPGIYEYSYSQDFSLYPREFYAFNFSLAKNNQNDFSVILEPNSGRLVSKVDLYQCYEIVVSGGFKVNIIEPQVNETHQNRIQSSLQANVVYQNRMYIVRRDPKNLTTIDIHQNDDMKPLLHKLGIPTDAYGFIKIINDRLIFIVDEYALVVDINNNEYLKLVFLEKFFLHGPEMFYNGLYNDILVLVDARSKQLVIGDIKVNKVIYQKELPHNLSNFKPVINNGFLHLIWATEKKYEIFSINLFSGEEYTSHFYPPIGYDNAFRQFEIYPLSNNQKVDNEDKNVILINDSQTLIFSFYTYKKFAYSVEPKQEGAYGALFFMCTMDLNPQYDYAVVKNILNALKTNKSVTELNISDIPLQKEHMELLENLKTARPNLVITESKSIVKTEATIESEMGLQLISSGSLSYGKLIGEGAFGRVFFGQWRSADVAIKKLLTGTLSEKTKKEFVNEATLMGRLQSSHVVQLYGICLEHGETAMVMEYVIRGSLFGLLHDDGLDIPWNIRYQYAIDIGIGLAYLHSQEILHRDLKSHNVLITGDDRAKLTDFGLATVKHEVSSSTTKSQKGGNAGTILWMAPELFKRNNHASPSSDVYSYGMVMWELSSRKRPYEEATDIEVAKEWIKDGDHDEIPEETPLPLWAMIKRCWEERTKRPSAQEIVNNLQEERPVEYGESSISTSSDSKDDAPSFINNFGSQ